MSPRVLTTLFLSFLAGCSPKAADVLVLEVGPSKVMLKEYENFFTKNSGGWSAARQSSQQERERFLDLLTNYQLKLRDAYDRNLMNDTEIVHELQEYRLSLAATYMIDRDLTEPGTRMLYEHKKEELRTQHILIALTPEASSKDTLKAYNQALEMIRKIKAGENMDTLARHNSADPSVQTMGADNYYFSAGQMPPAYEDAAYALKPGEVTERPIRTQFGYYVIRLTDRKPSSGKIKVRHLMTLFKKMNPDSAEDAAAHSRILSMQDSLKKGWDFAKLAAKFSEDVGSASQGGELGGWFERRRWVLAFDEACFKLGVGQVSAIVRSPLGYHIIKCDSIQPLAPFGSIKDGLRKEYLQQRYPDEYRTYIAAATKESNFRFNEEVFGRVVALLDSTKNLGDSAWDATVTPDVRKMTLMTVGGIPISVDSVLGALGRRPDFHNTILRNADLRPRVDRIGETFILGYKSRDLESRYPEFGSLMKEYNDGVILYKAEQLEVWNKNAVTDSALRRFYEENKTKFKFPERVNVAEIDVLTDTLAALLSDSLSHGADFTKLSARHNIDEDLKGKGGVRGMLPVGTDEITKLASSLQVGQVSDPTELSNGSFTIVKLLGREPERIKSFEEAGPEVSNLYQDQMSKTLEKEWLERLRQKYPVKQYREALKNAFASPPPGENP